MASLLFALVGCFLASLGARDQLLVAHLRERLGPSIGLLLVAIGSSIITALIAASAGAWLAGMMSESAGSMFVALALAMAAAELAWPHKPWKFDEPTRSLGAAGLVLLARQLTDGARFLVLAVAATTALPTLAGVGGAIGGAAAVALGWALGDALEKLPLRVLRLTLAGLLFVLAILIGLSARGLIG